MFKRKEKFSDDPEKQIEHTVRKVMKCLREDAENLAKHLSNKNSFDQRYFDKIIASIVINVAANSIANILPKQDKNLRAQAGKEIVLKVAETITKIIKLWESEDKNEAN